ncbi:MAG: nucleoside hydrolase [bacterium]
MNLVPKNTPGRRLPLSGRRLVDVLAAAGFLLALTAALLWMGQAAVVPLAYAHEIKIPVIVDTDMALDDVRALAMMFNSPHVEVKAVVTADGSSSAQAGYRNLLRILKFLEAPEIPVGRGKSLDQPPPAWRERSESLGWAQLPAAAAASAAAQESAPEAVSVIISTLSKAEDTKITYVCLGPLTNLAGVLEKNPSARDRIAGILYAGTPPDAPDPDWNTSRDRQAARAVFSCGLPLYTFSTGSPGGSAEPFSFDSELLQDIRKYSTRSARLIDLLHSDSRMQKLMQNRHFKIWDELVALYLNDSSLGGREPVQIKNNLFAFSQWDWKTVRPAYLELVSGIDSQKLSPRIPVILEQYPTNPGDFREDLRPLIPKIIAVHGVEEWKAALLTNELHRHLGIYSIFGAKMGIRAREILGASLDELSVESMAGLKPPVSCMNDGLQVSTGASLGRGTIRVIEEKALPEATFVFGSKKLHMRIKDDILKRIQADIKDIVQRFGSLTPQYFEEVRKLSFRYWADMNRSQIFEETLGE